ncbi:alpha/beta hydrolase [Saccharopolyspora sp. HNM0983]|uniref:Alpha/beta hydrolase n=1 Tax=Saccharopolyspora montiporae TaxID=2781240 RepID=A0A929BAS8_9PSEU|nr:alpha/beta hydrolase [Saccharopolyspora sp. HNM0983]
MTSRHLVHPDLRFVVEQFPAVDLSDERLGVLRGAIGDLDVGEPSAQVRTTERSATAPGAQRVRVLVSRPAGAAEHDLPVLVWLHGGGYVLGTPEMNQPLADELVTELGCVVVSVDYRLAPETPHPGPVEDCCTALRWVRANAAELGVDEARILVGGESAGGGLAAAAALLARDRDEVGLRAQLLVYPMLDDRTCVDPDPNPYAGEFVWTRAQNRYGWQALLGHEPGLPSVSRYAAAARAEDLAGAPPAFLAVGALDLFVDENIGYAHRLLRAGVPTELHVQPGAVHGYFSAAGTAPGDWLRGRVFEYLAAAMRA